MDSQTSSSQDTFLKMSITRLSWAGLQLTQNHTTLYIDPLENTAPLIGFLGLPLTEIVPIEPASGKVYALLTHLHQDHYDHLTLKRLLGSKGVAFGPGSWQKKASELGLSAFAAYPGQPFVLGPFQVSAVPAVD